VLGGFTVTDALADFLVLAALVAVTTALVGVVTLGAV
jgi:hypothetical protein